MKRNQLIVLLVLLIANATSAFLSYALFSDQMATMLGVPMPELGVSNVVLGLANAGIVLVLYGLIGLVGYWFALKLELPGIYREDGNWRGWVLTPLLLGALTGVALILGDLVFAPFNDFGRVPHPEFPFSLLASLSAGIGEEIIFRGFIFGLWALILNWALKKHIGQSAALWIANIIAALAFGAGHLGTAIALTNATSIADLHPILLAEIFLLNGIVGLVAGQQYIKTGLIAAIGVHFWTDIVWHVIWGLIS
jgi:membrane protease YdiL (CAAX protease family)